MKKKCNKKYSSQDIINIRQSADSVMLKDKHSKLTKFNIIDSLLSLKKIKKNEAK